MRLLVATPLYPPESGGPATYVKLLEEGLSARDIEVEVVKFSNVRKFPPVLRHVAYMLEVLRRGKDSDALLALDPLSVGWPTLFANLLLQKPLFVKVVGDHVWEQGTQRFGIRGTLDEFPGFSWGWHPYLWFLRMLQFIVVRSAKKVSVPSAYLRGIVMKWGVPSKKIEVIHNAVSVEDRGTTPDAIKRLPRPLVVSIGRLVPWKGMDGVIDAVAGLRSTGTGVSLAIVGDGPLKETLEEKAAKELAGNYAFSGRLSHEDTLAVLADADVFVLNSSYEGLSHLLVEAVTLGTRVVATDAGGNGEVVEGPLVPVHDTGALIDTLRSTLKKQKPSPSGRFLLENMLASTATFLKANI